MERMNSNNIPLHEMEREENPSGKLVDGRNSEMPGLRRKVLICEMQIFRKVQLHQL